MQLDRESKKQKLLLLLWAKSWVQIMSNIPLVAVQRVIYKLNTVPVSLSELMGLPGGLLDTMCRLPWYNHLDLNTQLRIGAP